MCKHVLIFAGAMENARDKTCRLSPASQVWRACRRALSLSLTPARRFGSCQWQTTTRPPLTYVFYRWILFLLIMSVGVASFACQTLPANIDNGFVTLNLWKWFIYFTNWGFILVALQAGLALAVVHKYRAEEALSISNEESALYDARSGTPVLCRVYWVTHTVATDLAFVITAVYWSLVYDPRVHTVDALNVLVHGGNSLVMLCELMVTAHPMRPAHALYGVCAGLAYGVFSAIYWAAGGTDRLGQVAIYQVLDWSKPGKAVGFVAVCVIVLCCAHAVATALTVLRGRLASWLADRRSFAQPVEKHFPPLTTH